MRIDIIELGPLLDERFVQDLEKLKDLGDVWLLEEIEDGRELLQDKGSTLTLSCLRVSSLFLALKFLEERFS